MKLTLTATAPRTVQTLVFGLFKKNEFRTHPFAKLLAKEDRQYIETLLKKEKVGWGEKSTKVLPLPSDPTRHVVLLGLGDKKKWNLRKRSLMLRKAVALLKEHRIPEAALRLEDFPPVTLTQEGAVRRATEELLLADFTFVRYKKKPKDGWPEVNKITFVVPKATAALRDAVAEGEIIGEAVNASRELANTPGGDMTPEALAQAARRKKAPKLKITVFTEKKIKQLGMGGVMGVSRGSAERPRFIIMEYKGVPASKRKKGKPLVFLGKGVTFDTGGLNLKPGDSINEMHMDMSGGAAVINALWAIARLKLPVHVIGLVPAVENMPSGSSYHPGDVLKTISGKTIEVRNTDAEGRLILADALGFAQRYKPKLMVDVATLTGAAVVALGQRVTGLFTQDEKLEKLGREVGQRSGDDVWPMPCWDEYAEELQAVLADVANLGKTRYGGAITAALFLRQFVGNFPWIHLDIAPTMTVMDGQYMTKGSAGAGVRFLVEMARHHAEK